MMALPMMDILPGPRHRAGWRSRRKMTDEMLRTKLNIMMTARLLLMPVLQVGGIEACALGEGGLGVEGDDRRDGEQ